MSTALTVKQLTPDALTMITSVAPTIHSARLFGTASAEQAAAIMIKGFELGFSLTASFENIHVIEGKPSLSPKGALALIYNSPECAGVSIKDEVDSEGKPLACTVWMKRRNGLEYTARYSLVDAQRAGIVKDKSGWEKYPANMLRWRAIGYAADIVFPDIIGGTKRADEFGADLTPDGDVIEGSWKQVGSQHGQVTAGDAPVQNVSTKGEGTVSQITLQTLLATYTADEIMGANGGKIPMNNDEVAAVAEKLGANGE